MTRIVEDAAAVALAGAEMFVERCAAARERFTVALSGGNTPRTLHGVLAGPLASKVDWGKVHVFWGDDRWVPPTDHDSNEAMARETLLGLVPIPASQIHPMYDGSDPEHAAKSYTEVLQRTFGEDHHTFDLCYLGLGTDGHTASLFPGDKASLKSEAWVLPTTSPAGVKQRLTLTPKVLCASAQLVFLVAGEDKGEPILKVFSGADLPSSYVAGHAKNVAWILDKDAARLLPGS